MIRKYIFILASPLFFVSCSAVDSTSRSMAKLSPTNLWSSRVDVVEVHEDRLQEMPLGKEKALAFDQERKRSFWSSISSDFEEPELPEIDETSGDYSLLPPKPL